MIPLKQLGRLLRPGLMLPFLLLAGCNSAILNPKGQIGHDEKQLLITSVVLMLIVVIPVIVMTIAFAWKYRASNTKARYEPDWSHSTAIEVVVWSIPCVIILVLAVLTWRSSHALDPYRPLDSDVKPITIEAVSLDWKWMFIYPDQNIATVNEIAFPVHTPLNFKITSDTVMNSFFIPHLGTMIYAMGIIEALRARYPAMQGPRHDDICYATQNRQDAVRDLARQCDLVLVVGSPNSSNSNRLSELARRDGVESYLIDNASEIDPAWIVGKQHIGLTAGASAPQVLVDGVLERLRELGAAGVSELEGEPESMVFALPKELRLRLVS